MKIFVKYNGISEIQEIGRLHGFSQKSNNFAPTSYSGQKKLDIIISYSIALMAFYPPFL